MNRTFMVKNVLPQFLFIIILFNNHSTRSQDLNFELNYQGFFDNREYFHELSPHYSLFGNRITSGFNLTLNDSNKLHGGISYLYEFGDLVSAHDPKFYTYYADIGKFTDFYIGLFPRTKMMPFNRALLNDTVRYFRPFMEGTGVRFKTPFGKLEGWLDWTSRQTDTIRETFLIGIAGQWSINSFFINHQLLALHYANTKNAQPDDHIQDNIGSIITAGLELDNISFLDKLSFHAGAIVSFDRLRTVYDWQTPAGFLALADVVYKWLTINVSYYNGDSHNLKFGDNFYAANSYARFDGDIEIFNSKLVQGKVQFSIHLIEDEINYSQLLLLTFDLNRKIYTFNR